MEIEITAPAMNPTTPGADIIFHENIVGFVYAKTPLSTQVADIISDDNIVAA